MALLIRAKLRLAGIAALLALSGGCAALDASSSERLDPVTGSTFGRAGTPLRFYRDNSGRAAYARDYVYLGPLWVNNMGDYRYYLWLGAWSTHADSGEDPGRRDALESVTILADGEPLSLQLASWTYGSIGVSAPVYARPVATAVDAYYQVTLDQVRLLADASDIRILTGSGEGRNYEVWGNDRRGRESLRRFVSR